MDLPLIISAEAAVRSKRPGFISVLDAKSADIQPGNLKRFFADPQLIKEAVQKLKADGFVVTNAGKMTVSLMAPPLLFMRVFNINTSIVMTDRGPTVEGSNRFGYIPTGNSAYADLLAGVALAPRTQLLDNPPEPEGNQIKPAQLREKLNFGQQVAKKLEGSASNMVNIAVLDTGFDQEQSYLAAKLQAWPGKKELEALEIPEAPRILAIELAKKDQVAAFLIQNVEQFEELFEQLKPDDLAGSGFWELDEHDNVQIVQRFKEIRNEMAAKLILDPTNSIQQAKSILEIGEKNDDYWRFVEKQQIELSSGDYHGTAVIIPLLELLPNSKGLNLQGFNIGNTGLKGFMDNDKIAAALANIKPDGKALWVVNCSFGNYAEQENKEPEGDWYKTAKGAFSLLAKSEKVTIVFAAGNYNEENKQRHIEPQWPWVISVGGAYKTDGDKYSYSKATHGYQSEIFKDRIVPDVCGWEGPQGDPRILLPTGREGWRATSGSSICAPQVTAACVLIKKVWPAANTEDIRQILIGSADEVSEGDSFQDKPMATLKHNWHDGEKIVKKAPGLVNFEKAIELAFKKSYQ